MNVGRGLLLYAAGLVGLMCFSLLVGGGMYAVGWVGERLRARRQREADRRTLEAASPNPGRWLSDDEFAAWFRLPSPEREDA